MVKKHIYNYLRLIKRKLFPRNVVWQGNYKTWSEALKHCSGYSEDDILKKVKNAALRVKNGEAAYERDSVLFYKPQITEELVSTMQQIPLTNGVFNVLDFGGSLGSSFYQNRDIMLKMAPLRWYIVEQAHYVSCGRKYFEDEELQFYYSIEECLIKNNADVLLSACMLQYLESPYTWIENFINSGITHIILDRVAYSENDKDILTVQTVPPSIYKASYPCWFLNEKLVISLFETNNFEIVNSWDDSINIPVNINGIKGYWKSFLFRKILD